MDGIFCSRIEFEYHLSGLQVKLPKKVSFNQWELVEVAFNNTVIKNVFLYEGLHLCLFDKCVDEGFIARDLNHEYAIFDQNVLLRKFDFEFQNIVDIKPSTYQRSFKRFVFGDKVEEFVTHSVKIKTKSASSMTG